MQDSQRFIVVLFDNVNGQDIEYIFYQNGTEMRRSQDYYFMKRSLKSLDGQFKARVVYGGTNTFVETNCITIGMQQYRELPNGQIV